MNYLLVALGGALGALSRVLLMSVVPEAWHALPLRILFVNCISAFVAGLFVEIFLTLWNAPVPFRHFLFQGFLGGLSTFSAFTVETSYLIEEGKWGIGGVYVIASVVLCLVAFTVGIRLIRLV